MDFNFEIKKYNQDSSQILVLYSPTNLEPKYKWVNIEANWSEQQIKDGIATQFPAYLWQTSQNPSIGALLETQGSATYVEPVVEEHVVTQDELADQARSRRRGLLMDSDWTQLPDAPLTDEQKLAWGAYRQELRDITAQTGFPNNIVWPVKE